MDKGCKGDWGSDLSIETRFHLESLKIGRMFYRVGVDDRGLHKR